MVLRADYCFHGNCAALHSETVILSPCPFVNSTKAIQISLHQNGTEKWILFSTKSTICQDMTSCCLVEVYWHLRGMYYLHLHGWWVNQQSKKYFGFPCQSSFHQILHNHNLWYSVLTCPISCTMIYRDEINQIKSNQIKSNQVAWLHCLTSQKIVLFMVTDVRTSNGLYWTDHRV
jgi:hypothetical protein